MARPISHRFRAAGRLAMAGLLAAAPTVPGSAQDRGLSYTFFGTPGLLEMPSALSADDGEITGTVAYFGGQLRTSFTFQITPRLSGTFRYGSVADYAEEGEGFYDRSFDLRFRLTEEGRFAPALAVGLQDFLGTGIYSGEYVVATKTIGDSLRVTAGLGWGRLGSHNGFSNPLGVISERFETRSGAVDVEGGKGGTIRTGEFFRGDAALFGGVEWAPTDRLTVKLEYSSDDDYTNVDGEPLFDVESPLNVGLNWRPLPGVQLQAAYLYGTQLGFGATFAVNPNERVFGGGLDAPPQPVAVRPEALRAAQSWDRAALPPADLRARLQAALRTEGIELAAVEVTDWAARVRYTNTRFRSEAQALGRVARILTQELPPSVERLTLEPQQAGIPLSAVTFARSDVEAFENEVGGTAAALARADFEDAGPAAGLTPLPPVRDSFSWGVRPYFSFTVFDGDAPVQLGLGAELSASYRIRPALVLSGALRQRILESSNAEDDEVPSDDEPVPQVRTIVGLYGQDGHPVIEDLTLARYGRPGANIYSRVTVGYLEQMYGGLSTELLWKPVTSRWGLGAEVNYVVQRDFDQLLAFRDYEVLTGHASLYYGFQNGFHGQIDAGRYLAGDWGATLAIDREFENGWRIGAYATLTDIPFEDFGEGSFDKGIRISIPIDFVLGRPTQRTVDSTLRSLNRDGGARLDVGGRLYDVVRGGQYGDLEDSWGRFWR